MSAIELAPARLITSVASASRSGTSSKKALQLGREPDRLVGRPHPVHVLRPHLLAEPQPRAQLRRRAAAAPPAPRRAKSPAPWLPPITSSPIGQSPGSM